MSDHQFQEREFEGNERESVDMADLMDMLIGGPQLLSGALGRQQTHELLNSLPRLNEEDLARLGHGNKDTTCPVCITPFPAIIAEEEMAQVMESPAHAFEEMGVTRLWIEDREEGKRGCGHLFCRRCISKWILGGHDSCPMCRRMLIPPSADSGTASEPTTVPPNAAEEAALQQLQHQMRALRAMLDGNIANTQRPASGDGRADLVRHNLLGADMFGMYSGRNEEQDHGRNEYAGMYS